MPQLLNIPTLVNQLMKLSSEEKCNLYFAYDRLEHHKIEHHRNIILHSLSIWILKNNEAGLVSFNNKSIKAKSLISQKNTLVPKATWK